MGDRQNTLMESRRFTSRQLRQEAAPTKLCKDDAAIMLLWGIFLLIIAGLAAALAGPEPVAYMPETKAFSSLLVLQASSIAKYIALGTIGAGIFGVIVFPTNR